MPGVVAGAAAIALSTAVGAAVASGVFTALGAATFAAFAVASIVGAIVSVGITAGITLGIGAAISAVFGGARARDPSGIVAALGRTVTVRQSIVAAKILYGETRQAGALTFIEGSEDNKKLTQVVTIAGHPVTEFLEVFLNGESVELNSDGLVTSGEFENFITIKFGLGTTAGDANFNSFMQSETEGWTVNHKQTGCAKAAVQFRYDREVFASALPNVSFRLAGKKVLDPRKPGGAPTYSNNAALCLYDYLLDNEFGLKEKTARMGSTFAAAANICDEKISLTTSVNFTVDTTSQLLTLAEPVRGFKVGDKVTLTSSGILPAVLGLNLFYYVVIEDGVEKILLSFDLDDAFAGRTLEIVGRGYGIHTIHRQQFEQLAGAVYRNSILLNEKIAGLETGNSVSFTRGKGGTLPLGIYENQEYIYKKISDLEGSLFYLHSGRRVKIYSSGTGNISMSRISEKRYTANGSVSSDQSREEILRQMLTATNGSLIYQSGVWNTYLSYQVPGLETLTVADLDGPMQIGSLISKREIFNQVSAVISTNETNFIPTNMPVVKNELYLEEDGGEVINAEIALPFTTSSATAQRIAKIQLEKTRQQISMVLQCNLKAFRHLAGGGIRVTNERFGFVDKNFSIESWSFATRQGENAAPRLGIDLFLQETGPAIYDWNSGEETRLDPEQNTTLPNPFKVLPPGNLTAQEEIYHTRESGGVKTRVILRWLASNDAFARNYEIQYRNIAAKEFTVTPLVDALELILQDFSIGIYIFRVFAVNDIGIKSEIFSEAQLETHGLTAAPQALKGLTINTISGIAYLRWDAPSRELDLDVLVGGRILFRHSSLRSGALRNNSVSIGKAVSGSETHVSLPLKAGTYFAEAQDSTGIIGPAVAVTTGQANALTFSTLGRVIEDPTFSGIKTNVNALGGVLRLDHSKTNPIRVVPFGSYKFGAGIDLGAIKNARLTAFISAILVIETENIDDRNVNIDDWLDFDGADAQQSDAKIYVRQTDQDPAGNPVWSDYELLDASDFRARAFEFKIDLISREVTTNILVGQLRVYAEEVV